MRKFICGLVLLAGLSFGVSSIASDEHGHGADEHEHGGDEHGHEEVGGHEEASPIVGAAKGITERSQQGFKLSAEAIKSFALEMAPLSSATVEVAKKSILTIKDAKFIYRVRESWIAKTPIQVLSQNKDKIRISVSSYATGDKIITQGVGFIRTSELLLEQGASHGHSH